MPKVQRVRDPIHDLIEFDVRVLDQTCWDALATRPLQRLRRIKQLGFSDYVYPGASHSRLAHSIGVFHTARLLSAVVEERLGGSGGRFQNRKSQIAIAAALVHDIGHGPFSHAFEHALDGVGLSRKHELRTAALIRETELAEVFERGFDADFSEEIIRIIQSKYPADIYASIVSSQFDADRLDYMRRDRLMTGTQQSAIDFSWLKNNLEVRKVPVGVDDQQVKNVETFVLNQKARITAEGYALSLFYLYINVYFHKTTRGLEKLFTALMGQIAKRVIDGDVASTGLSTNHPIVGYLRDPDSVEMFLRLDDSVVYGCLSSLAEASDPVIADLAIRIRDRKCYRCIDVSKIMAAKLERPDEADRDVRAEARKKALAATAQVAELVKERGILASSLDETPAVLEDEALRTAYKQTIDERGKLSSIFLLGPDDKLHDLANISPVVDAVGEYRAYRLYVRDDDGEKLVNQILKEVTQ